MGIIQIGATNTNPSLKPNSKFGAKTHISKVLLEF